MMNTKLHSIKSGLRALMGAVVVVAALVFASCSSTGIDDPAAPVDPVKSAVCTLSALTVSSGTLTPAFDPTVTSYAVELESSVKSITVTGTAADAKATVSESGSAARTIAIGETAITLTVTAEDGTAKAYTVTAFRKPVVYVAGYYHNGASYIPCYWKGSEKTDLSVPAVTEHAYATDICLVDDAVYVSGYYWTGNTYIGCYWKDGERKDLVSGSGSSFAYEILVDNGTVYIAGAYTPSGVGDKFPCYWNGDTRVVLESSGTTYGQANDIAIDKGEVYTSGRFYNESTGYYDMPCYWKGTERSALVHSQSTYTNGEADDIVVIDDVVRVVARYSTETDFIGTFWDNGTPWDFTVDGAQDTWLNALAVDNGQVYRTGMWSNAAGDFIPCVVNGTVRSDLSVAGDACEIRDIAVLDGRTFVAGTNNPVDSTTQQARYWDGTKRIELSNIYSTAMAIALGE
jgi:hypothetical protein